MTSLITALFGDPRTTPHQLEDCAKGEHLPFGAGMAPTFYRCMVCGEILDSLTVVSAKPEQST